jgi:hypothetical protein
MAKAALRAKKDPTPKSKVDLKAVPIAKTSSRAPAAPDPKESRISIPAPDLRIVEFDVVGTAPYVQNRFSNKAQIMAKQAEGSTGGKGKQRTAKDFDALYENAKHKSPEGWCGIPAPSFRAAMISACRLVGFQMTRAKLSLFVLADGLDEDGSPIVKIKGTPEMHTAHVRNETGVVDIRARPMWREWSCKLRVRFDADQFTATDVANLMMRAGMQIGIGEGRADSKKSLTGMNWGFFAIDGGDA